MAKSKVGAAVTFRILGAVTARGSKTSAMVTVMTKQGTGAVFQIDRVPAAGVKARIMAHLAGKPVTVR